MDNTEPVARTSEIEELTNLYVIHPISSRLALLLARLHVSANAVSFAGMACGIIAGISYYHYQRPIFTIIGFFLMVMWHVMDGADGQLARLTHSQSELGKILDGICDYVTFTAVYAGLALTLSRQLGDWVWAVVIVAGACHAVQAAAYEVQRQDYNFWGRGQKSAELLDPSLSAGHAAASPVQRVADRLHRIYARVQLLAAGIDPASRQALAAALRLQPEHDAAIRRRYREVFAPTVRRWSVMSANYRTLGIFIFSLLQLPLFYFYFEIFGFSAILVGLLYWQRARYRQFFMELDMPT